MLLMRTFLGPMKWHRAVRRVPFGAQNIRDVGSMRKWCETYRHSTMQHESFSMGFKTRKNRRVFQKWASYSSPLVLWTFSVASGGFPNVLNWVPDYAAAFFSLALCSLFFAIATWPKMEYFEFKMAGQWNGKIRHSHSTLEIIPSLAVHLTHLQYVRVCHCI